jgi:hypothetical protein
MDTHVTHVMARGGSDEKRLERLAEGIAEGSSHRPA